MTFPRVERLRLMKFSRIMAVIALLGVSCVPALSSSSPQEPPAQAAPAAQTPAPSQPQAATQPESTSAPSAEPVGSAPLRVMVGKSLLINTTGRLKRVSVTDPTVADALVVTPTQIIVHGRAPGEVSLLIWGANWSALPCRTSG